MSPELGQVGMAKQDARRNGHAVCIGRFDFRNKGKA
ncbi:hypothetical protein [Noviherbaspirillum sp.]